MTNSFGQPPFDRPQNEEQPHSRFPPPADASVPPDPSSTQTPKERNIFAIVALICAVAGVGISFLNGGLVVGWLLLIIALILSVVSLTIGKKKRGVAIVALIVSVGGFTIAPLAFIALVRWSDEQNQRNNAFDFDYSEQAQATEETATARPQSSRENPLPMGSTIEDENWSVTINSVNFDGDYVIMAENAANSAPDPGKQYILVNITVTLKADIPNGSKPMADVEYVATDGTTSNPYDKIIALESAFKNTATVYQGGSITGDLIFEAPVATAAEGVLSARPERFGDKGPDPRKVDADNGST
ncbi:DUF4352 domain-containing protein, partial [Corynebacterium flavescens]|uniref:DUF4352 domain-containing protein n=1 Tax=Corynebacterium flavescens TaxID=28028 RepID=UPI003FD1BB5E